MITQPVVPALPGQVVDVTSTRNEALRGVGFGSGTYTDAAGALPLTGAPATEQNGLHTRFDSAQFYPQQMGLPNYFDALGAAGTDGRTRLVVTPAQYRSDAVGSATDVQRAYSDLRFTLCYSGNTQTYGANTPALAEPPSISGMQSVTSGEGVHVSAHVTGDPSAGIQGAWVTYTATSGPLHGRWQSVDLAADQLDSTLWAGTIGLPSGQSPADVRFIVQAVNGVGGVGLDNNLGAYYSAGVYVGPVSGAPTSLALAPVPSPVTFGGRLFVAATLSGAPPGSPVTFTFRDTVTGSAIVRATAWNGRADAGSVRLGTGMYSISASFGEARAGTSANLDYAGSHSKSATALLVPGVMLLLH